MAIRTLLAFALLAHLALSVPLRSKSPVALIEGTAADSYDPAIGGGSWASRPGDVMHGENVPLMQVEVEVRSRGSKGGSKKDGSKSNKDGSKSKKDGSKSNKDGSKSNKDGSKSNKDGSKDKSGKDKAYCGCKRQRSSAGKCLDFLGPIAGKENLFKCEMRPCSSRKAWRCVDSGATDKCVIRTTKSTGLNFLYYEGDHGVCNQVSSVGISVKRRKNKNKNKKSKDKSEDDEMDESNDASKDQSNDESIDEDNSKDDEEDENKVKSMDDKDDKSKDGKKKKNKDGKKDKNKDGKKNKSKDGKKGKGEDGKKGKSKVEKEDESKP